MKQIEKYISLLLITIFYSSIVAAKPRIVDIEREIRIAKFVGYVTIDSYTDTSVAFSMIAIAFKLRLDSSAADGYDIKKELTAKLKSFEKSLIGKEVTGGLPKEGANVLIVVDLNDFVSLFADASTAYLMFWSPIYTGSECLFNYGNNFSADTIGKQQNIFAHPLDKPKVPEIIKQCSSKIFISSYTFEYNYIYNNYEAGSILIEENDIIFSPPLADGRCYKIKSKLDLKKFDGKNIIAYGRLKNDSEFEITEFKEIE